MAEEQSKIQYADLCRITAWTVRLEIGKSQTKLAKQHGSEQFLLQESAILWHPFVTAGISSVGTAHCYAQCALGNFELCFNAAIHTERYDQQCTDDKTFHETPP